MRPMEPERMTSLDASFWYMERPSMHMHVAATSVFEPREDGPLTFQDVRRVVRTRIHLAPRLRQRVLAIPFNLARPVWVDDDRFDLTLHLHNEAIPAPGGRTELEDAVGRALSVPLDRSRPLWEIHVFEGLEASRTAVLLKLHHAMADGIGGMLVASVLFDLEADAESPEPAAGRWRPLPLPSAQELLFEAARESLTHPVGALGRAVEAPSRALAEVAGVIGGARSIAGLGRPPAGPFDVMVKPARRFAMAEVPFDVVHRAKAGLDATVNDIVLAAVAKGLHDLLELRGVPTRGRSLRVMVPVSVRSGAEEGDVGNRVAPAFLDVPVGAMRPRARLQRISRATKALKASSMAVGADSIIGLGALAPAAIHAMAARVVSRARWFNLVVSNVPAPQIPLYLGGARMLATYPGMPLAENCGLSIACTSLAGTMAFGLTADWDAVPDVEKLARAIEGGLEELAALVV
jgi:diacylglycerol O-acyltransferase / wax synthase